MGLKRIPVAVSARVDKMKRVTPIKHFLRLCKRDRTRYENQRHKLFSGACGSSFPRFAEQRFALGAHDIQVIGKTPIRALSRHRKGAGGHRSYRTTATAQLCAPRPRPAKCLHCLKHLDSGEDHSTVAPPFFPLSPR